MVRQDCQPKALKMRSGNIKICKIAWFQPKFYGKTGLPAQGIENVLGKYKNMQNCMVSTQILARIYRAWLKQYLHTHGIRLQ